MPEKGVLEEKSHRRSTARPACGIIKSKTASLDIPIRSLSGGNVQKAIVAREFTAGADVIVLNQPTRGVDVGAMEFIDKKILKMRDERQIPDSGKCRPCGAKSFK